MARNTSVSLGDHFEEFIAGQVDSGRYGSASEVVRAGLRLLETNESRFEVLRNALVAGEQVKISSFGTFSVRDKTARVGRNPKTGEEVPISPRRVLTFRPSHLMRDRVAAGSKKK